MNRLRRAWRELQRSDADLPAPLPLRLYAHDHLLETQLRRIAVALEHIDHKTVKRRQRVIECKHPEFHPEEQAS